MNSIVLYLIRKKLRVKPYQKFRFSNQKKHDLYYFTSTNLMKIDLTTGRTELSNVSLNWLLDKECKVRKAYESIV